MQGAKDEVQQRQELDAWPCYLIAACRARSNALRLNRTLAAGPLHTLVTTRNGQVYAFGHGGHGKLGLGPACANATTPRVVKFTLCSPLAPRVRITQVAAGHRHSVALCVLGHVYTWGSNEHGQLGHGTPGADACAVECPDAYGRGVTLLSEVRGRTGWRRAAALAAAAAEFAECRSSTWISSPRRVEAIYCGSGHRIVEVCCGDYHTLLLASDGRVRSCGAGRVAGVGVCADVWVPTLLWRLAERGVIIVKVAAAGWHSLALSAEGDVFSWGIGDGGRLGHGDDEPRAEPTLVRGLCGERVIHVDCGAESSTAYAVDPPRLFWWGHAEPLAHVGDFSEHIQAFRRPTLCPDALPPDARATDFGFLSLSGGIDAGVLVLDTNRVAYRLNYQLNASLSKRPLGLPAPCVAVACSDEHMVSCTQDGRIYAAGNGGQGRLGLGSHTSYDEPQPVTAIGDLC